MIRRSCVIVWLVMVAVAIGVIATMADASPSCLTKAEARSKYPKDHLWWHGSQRCWNNSPKMERPVVKKNPLAIPKPRPPMEVSEHDFNELDAQAGPPRSEIYYPSLIAGSGVDAMFLDVVQMTQWPLLIDGIERFIPWTQRIAGTGLTERDTRWTRAFSGRSWPR